MGLLAGGATTGGGVETVGLTGGRVVATDGFAPDVERGGAEEATLPPRGYNRNFCPG